MLYSYCDYKIRYPFKVLNAQRSLSFIIQGPNTGKYEPLELRHYIDLLDISISLNNYYYTDIIIKISGSKWHISCFDICR